MKDLKVTLAALHSELKEPSRNLERVAAACARAQAEGARLLLLPELMLTGHGGHPAMTRNAEPVPGGPLSAAVLELSRKHDLCVCVGIAELAGTTVYNSQIVADRGEYLGLQRKIQLSGDEYCHFGEGVEAPVFDIGELRFGISICYDNLFPELALVHALNGADAILAPHAARTGNWPAELTPEFCARCIKRQQDDWEKVHRARAYDHNLYVLLCNAVGASTRGLEGVVANHAGTVMAVAPDGEVLQRTTQNAFSDEIVTVELKRDKRRINHAPSRNRRFHTLMALLSATRRSGGRNGSQQ